jgi:hypothetical protein
MNQNPYKASVFNERALEQFVLQVGSYVYPSVRLCASHLPGATLKWNFDGWIPNTELDEFFV